MAQHMRYCFSVKLGSGKTGNIPCHNKLKRPRKRMRMTVPDAEPRGVGSLY